MHDDHIEGLFAGAVQALAGDRGSAIDKQAVTDRRIRVGPLGLQGDEHADRVNHGGSERALLHYCARHYASWKSELPQAAARFAPPGFGENLTSSQLDEQNVCIGDIYRIGNVIVQVSQPRSPCWKLNRRFGVTDMAQRVQDSARCGWLYRVLEPGEIGSGDHIRLEQRPCAGLTVAAVMHALYNTPPERLDTTFVARIAETAEISPNWRMKAERRLRGVHDSAHTRLYGDT